jgi:hypothetical protein
MPDIVIFYLSGGTPEKRSYFVADIFAGLCSAVFPVS